MTKCVCRLYLLNLAQTLANAVVKVVIPTERYFRLNFLRIFYLKLRSSNLGCGVTAVGNVAGEALADYV